MSVWEYGKAILLGILEGITEWLPVSSTGHMLLLDDVLSLSGSEGFKDSFFVIIQLGAVLAVIRLFWQKMIPLGRGDAGGIVWKRDALLLWGKAALACLPGAAAVVLLRDAESELESPWVIAAALIGYGIVFLLLETGKAPRIRKTEEIRFRDALGVGLFQVLSVVPGTSRSGSTILGGLALGMDRSAAAEFSFILAVPVMAGYSGVKLLKNGIPFTPGEWSLLLTGAGTAYLVSLAVVKKLMDYVRLHSFAPFGWYRIALGAAVLVKLWVAKV